MSRAWLILPVNVETTLVLTRNLAQLGGAIKEDPGDEPRGGLGHTTLGHGRDFSRCTRRFAAPFHIEMTSQHDSKRTLGAEVARVAYLGKLALSITAQG